MVKHLVQLGLGAFLFALGLADWVGKEHFSHYILMIVGVAVAWLAIQKIQKNSGSKR